MLLDQKPQPCLGCLQATVLGTKLKQRGGHRAEQGRCSVGLHPHSMEVPSWRPPAPASCPTAAPGRGHSTHGTGSISPLHAPPTSRYNQSLGGHFNTTGLQIPTALMALHNPECNSRGSSHSVAPELVLVVSVQSLVHKRPYYTWNQHMSHARRQYQSSFLVSSGHRPVVSAPIPTSAKGSCA